MVCEFRAAFLAAEELGMALSRGAEQDLVDGSYSKSSGYSSVEFRDLGDRTLYR